MVPGTVHIAIFKIVSTKAMLYLHITQFSVINWATAYQLEKLDKGNVLIIKPLVGRLFITARAKIRPFGNGSSLWTWCCSRTPRYLDAHELVGLKSPWVKAAATAKVPALRSDRAAIACFRTMKFVHASNQPRCIGFQPSVLAPILIRQCASSVTLRFAWGVFQCRNTISTKLQPLIRNFQFQLRVTISITIRAPFKRSLWL